MPTMEEQIAALLQASKNAEVVDAKIEKQEQTDRDADTYKQLVFWEEKLNA